MFKGKSLCVINDFSIEERRYFFQKVYELKKAVMENNTEVLDTFRLNDPNFGIYEVFLEDSTRTKESFRNAANFHHAKLSELLCTSSSINKGESYADTFNMLTGYDNTIFIVRSKVEGLCKWLDLQSQNYISRNNLPIKPAFINAGDGKHEHPTQELLDEFSFLEENDMNFDYIHIALVGDLYHGRTVHSKADGLKVFKNCLVDLIAPKELAMPENYVLKMKENGFTVRIFDSLDEYVKDDNISKLWYFTRPQLERMGERILQKQAELRKAITFKKEYLDIVKEGTKLYHPLPRHKEYPTIPTWVDNTPLNGYEMQAINGMYARIILLALIGGKIGQDFEPTDVNEEVKVHKEYITKVENLEVKDRKISEGVNPIQNGIVIDHICKGQSPKDIRFHMSLINNVLKLNEAKGGEWISSTSNGLYKGIIFRPGEYTMDQKDLKRLAAVAPGATLNIIKDGKIEAKYRTQLPPRIYNFDDMQCKNPACISHPDHSEGCTLEFVKRDDEYFTCIYCNTVHSYKEIFKNIK